MDLTTLISSQADGRRSSSDRSGDESVVNMILVELKAMKSGWRAAFKSQVEVDRYKEQLLKACMENGINSIEQINAGLAHARRDESDFFPSVGKFVKWCKPEEHHEHIANRMATREFNANQKALEHKPKNREVGQRHIKEFLDKLKNQRGEQ